MAVVKREPHPTVVGMMAPNAVVVGGPSPWIVGDPGIAQIKSVTPITVLIRLPLVTGVRVVGIRNPVTGAFNPNPVSLSSYRVVRFKSGLIVVIRIGDHRGWRNVSGGSVESIFQNDRVTLTLNAWVIAQNSNFDLFAHGGWNVKAHAVIVHLKT